MACFRGLPSCEAWIEGERLPRQTQTGWEELSQDSSRELDTSSAAAADK